MPRIYITKLSGQDYFVVVILTCLMLWHAWEHFPEIKGVIGINFIEFSTTTGKIESTGTKAFGSARYPSRDGYDIWYSYKVKGVTYKSNQITFDAHVKKVDEYLQKYPVGKIVMVYYQTTKPKFSVLEPDSLSWGVVIRPLLALLVIAAYLFVNKRIGIKSRIKR